MEFHIYFLNILGQAQMLKWTILENQITFIESGYTEWFIPVLRVDRALPYPVVNIQGIDFYIAHGSKANHFMTDASFKSRNENAEIVKKKKLDEMLKECCK